MKITVPEEDLGLTSPGEALFYGLCWFHGVPVNALRPGSAGVEAEGVTYCPSFWVAAPEAQLGLAVEVSDGGDEAVMRPLRAAWRGKFRKALAVLYREDLDVLRDAYHPAQFTARLRRIEAQAVRMHS